MADTNEKPRSVTLYSQNSLLVVDVEGYGPPVRMSPGDTMNVTITSRFNLPDMRVYLKVLDSDERWPTPTLERLQDWLEEHGLDRSHGLEILRIMNDHAVQTP